MPNWLQVVIWTIVSIICLFFITKMIGKRQMNQMTFFEYIVGIAIGEIGAHIAMHLHDRVENSVIALAIYGFFPVVIGWMSLKNKIIREFVNGKSRPLVQKGQILTDNLTKERMTKEELLSRLRLKDVFSIADVEMAMMENSGNISVHLQPGSSPVTSKEIHSILTQNGQSGQSGGNARKQSPVQDQQKDQQARLDPVQLT